MLRQLAPMLIGPIAGFATNYLMTFIDDILKWTAKWPDSVKRGLVIAIGLLIPVLNQKFGVDLSTDPTILFSQPSVQGIIAVIVAFFLKHAGSTSNPTTTSLPADSKAAAIVNAKPPLSK